MNTIHSLEIIISDLNSLRSEVRTKEQSFHSLIKQLITLQRTFRDNKDFKSSDSIRGILLSIGVKVINGSTKSGERVDDHYTIELI